MRKLDPFGWSRRLRRRTFWLKPASLMLGCLVAVLTLYAVNVHILQLTELKVYDLRFLSRGPEKPLSAGTMVVINAKSLEAKGRLPWPRTKIAALPDHGMLGPRCYPPPDGPC
jgi:CHASE2 domain-containing sensor protein